MNHSMQHAIELEHQLKHYVHWENELSEMVFADRLEELGHEVSETIRARWTLFECETCGEIPTLSRVDLSHIEPPRPGLFLVRDYDWWNILHPCRRLDASGPRRNLISLWNARHSRLHGIVKQIELETAPRRVHDAGAAIS